MIIELCGLPASGKTTLAKKLSKERGFVRVVITKRTELLFRSIRFYVIHPILFLVTLYYIFLYSATSKLWYTKIMNSLLHRAARYDKAKHVKNAIIDEGFYQNLFSIFDKDVDFKKVEKYINFFPKVDSIIFCSVSKELINMRSKKRGYFGRENILNNMQHKEWVDSIFKKEKVIQSIFNKLNKNVIFNDKKDLP